MNISRNEVSEFVYASAGANSLPIRTIGTSNNDTIVIRITDIVVSNTASAGSLKLSISSYGSYGQPLIINIPENSVESCSFQIPYKMTVVASTLETRRFLASTVGANIDYMVSGYIEK